MFRRLKAWGAVLKREILVLWLAARDPRVPWAAKILAAMAAAYALSPIDLIPDFVPVLGYLDDLILLPAMIWLALRMIPPGIVAELRDEAARRIVESPPKSRTGAAAVVALWVGTAALAVWAFA